MLSKFKIINLKKLAATTALFCTMFTTPVAAFARNQDGFFPLPASLGLWKPMTAGGGAASYITSIQAFEITIATGNTTNTATISSVDTSLSWIWWCGEEISGGTASNTIRARATLTNATTVTATRGASSASDTVTIRGYVLEAKSTLIASVQQGTVSIANGASTGTATVSATTNGVVFFLHTSSASSSSSAVNFEYTVDLSGTTVTATRNSSTGAMTLGYVVVDFQSAVIQSIQTRSVTMATSATTVNDTISAVTMANAMIVWNGVFTAISSESDYNYRLAMTTTTNVALTRTGTSTTTRTVKYTVLEFVSGVVNSIQRGTTAIASAQSADTSISTVNTAKSLMAWASFSTTASAPSSSFATGKILDSTTVRCQKGVASTVTSTPAWEIVEFV